MTGNRTFIEVDSIVVTWWIVAFWHSLISRKIHSAYEQFLGKQLSFYVGPRLVVVPFVMVSMLVRSTIKLTEHPEDTML